MHGNRAAMAAILAMVASPVLAQDGQRLEDLIPDAAVADPEEWARDGVPAAMESPPVQPVPLESAGIDTAEIEPLAPGAASGEAEGGTTDNALPELSAPPLSTEPPPTDSFAVEEAAQPIGADAAMDEALVSLPWPGEMDLPPIEPLEPDEEPVEFVRFEDVLPTLAPGSEERISDELVLVFPTEQALFPYRQEFITRFNALSAIESLDADESFARFAAQAREDEDLLARMLRVYGYYDAQVIRSVTAIQPGEDEAESDGNGRSAVRYDLIPGPQYRVGMVDLGALGEAVADYPALREAYGVFPGDPLLMDRIEDERFNLDAALGDSGYPFAAIGDVSILVDHERREGDVNLPVTPGGRYVFGNVTSNMPDYLGGEHLAGIARFAPGDLYMRSEELDLQQAVLATGIVGSVSITPVETTAPVGDAPGVVDLAVEMTPAPLRTLAGSIGYGTEEGVRLAASWEHRNLFPPEGLLRVRGVAGTQEQLLGVTFGKHNFTGRDRNLTLDTFVSSLDYDAYDARTISLTGIYEQRSTLLFQKPLNWSMGLELVATGEREADAQRVFGPRRNYFIAALPLYVQVDTSDDLLDPTEGFRLGGRASPEIVHSDGRQTFYLRSQIDASYYRSMSENVVLAGRIRLAGIQGAGIEAIAPSRRLYAGGGGSVRGYGYRGIGPRNSEGDPAGGRSLTELSLEARIRTGLLDGALGVVPFIDAGTVGADAVPGFDEIKFGAGIGLRYYSPFGPIRIDVAAPLNPGPEDSPVAVYVALGQAF